MKSYSTWMALTLIAGGLLTTSLTPSNAGAYEGIREDDSYVMDSNDSPISTQAPRPASKPVDPYKACTDPSVNIHEAPIGYKCRTSRRAVFERVERDGFGEAWKGPDHRVWSQVIETNTQQGAIYSCLNLGGELPSPEAFMRGQQAAYQEVLSNESFSTTHDPESHAGYWTNYSVKSVDIPHFTYGRIWTNDTIFLNLQFDFLRYSVRCVSW